MSFWARPLLVLTVALAMCAGQSFAAERDAAAPKPWQYNPENRTVEMFEAMANGDIEVRLFQADATQGRVLIENKTGEPLNVQLPDAFAGVHVMNQVAGGTVQGIGQTAGGAFGGGGGGLGGGAGGGGPGGGFFNVPAEKVGQLDVVSVCLEHGKPDPRTSMTYAIEPLETHASAPEVREMLKLLAQGKIDQHVAQAVAWHFNSNMSWDELAAKQVRRLVGPDAPYFSAVEMQAAVAAAEYLTKKVEEDRKPPKQ